MRKLVGLISASILFSSPAVFAEEYAPDFDLNETQALALENVKAVIEHPEQASRYLNKIAELAPQGPAFVDGALELLVDESLDWSKLREPKDRLLSVVVRACQDQKAFKNFERSRIRYSIQDKARDLLAKFSSNMQRRDAIVEIFNAMSLWGVPDLPFLTARYQEGDALHFRKALATVAAEAKAIDLQGLTKLVRTGRNEPKMVPQRWFAYTLMFRHGLLSPDEYPDFLRYLIEHHLSGNLAADPLLKTLLRETYYDIQFKLKAGDQDWNAIFHTLERAPSWAGSNLSSTDILRVREFLKMLRTENFSGECVSVLTLKKVI